MHAPAPAADFDRSPGLTITEGSTSAEFGGRHFSLRFSKNDGVITSYVDKGMALLERGPRPDFWRATTDNDAGAGSQKALAMEPYRIPSGQACSDRYRLTPVEGDLTGKTREKF